MRVRMLNRPEVRDYINEKTVPVMWTVTDQGLPDLLPFEFFRQSYRTNPWPHIAFAIFYLLDPDGQRAYGCSGCGYLDQGGALAEGFDNLKRQMERYERVHELERRAVADPTATAELEAYLAGVDADVHRFIHCFHDVRLQTIRSVLGRRTAKWPDLVEAARPREPGEPEVMEPGLRENLIRALAQLLVDDSPFHEHATPHLRRFYSALSEKERGEWRDEALRRSGKRRAADLVAADVPVPPALRRVAARSLILLAEAPFDPDDPDLVRRVAAWWREHEEDERFRNPWITEAGDPLRARDGAPPSGR